MREMAQTIDKRLQYVRNGLEMWEKAEITYVFGKQIKYVGSGLYIYGTHLV